MDIIISLLVAALALTLLLAGFRLGRFVIPLWGFVSGMSIGGAIIADLSSTPFLATVTGIFVGILMGLLFAIFAYLYYSIAVIVMAAGVGYWLGSGFFYLIGLDPGFLSAVSGLIVGLAFGVVALMVDAPKWVLIGLTSVAGGVLLVGAGLLLFQQIPLEAFSYAEARQAVTASWWWSLVTVGLATCGILAQAATTKQYQFAKWSDENITPTHTPTATTPR